MGRMMKIGIGMIREWIGLEDDEDCSDPDGSEFRIVTMVKMVNGHRLLGGRGGWQQHGCSGFVIGYRMLWDVKGHRDTGSAELESYEGTNEKVRFQVDLIKSRL
ncbi:hypothetical protein B9Z55_020178 [Caenorhabditis nigoni]|uniref:Uncharacterized protein n=1 Tax=Caenorhabditis nigoni TaxID=1611254 RepID=A0A2G5TLK3_9PELO|nr:hypothetical protein B9Z55_020178 [Caenorhabditis nigoni]